MTEIVVYRTQHCGYCVRVHALLEAKGVPFKEIDVTDDAGKRRWLVDATKQRTVPQVFIDGKPVGGFDELARLSRSGELDRLLAGHQREGADAGGRGADAGGRGADAGGRGADAGGRGADAGADRRLADSV